MIIVVLLLGACGCHRDVPQPGTRDNTPVDSSGTTNNNNDTVAVRQKATFYVAVTGNDANPGTFDKPWRTWQKAFSGAGAGDTVFIRGGTYYPDADDECGVSVLGRKGTYSNPICIFNYPGENPVLDCSTLTSLRENIGILLSKCSYYHLKGLTVTGISQHGRSIESCGFSFELGGNYIIENCVSRGNQGSGFQGYATDSIALINCDSYNNFDIYTEGYSGGQADGFVFCFTSHNSYTYFKGCRSWYNSDDGFDCWENEGVVVFDACWAFNNGRGKGDGSGFKLGQTVKEALDVPQRVLTNCLAFKNRFIGFNQNDGNVKMTFYNNFAFGNDNIGFDIGQYNQFMIIRNNISYKNGSIGYFSRASINDHNSWNATTNINVSDADFISIDTTGVSGKRQSNNDLPVLNFLKLAHGSDLINAGIDVGLPFLGKAPDLGPYEKE
jgi:hypothetical protein